VVLQNSLLLIPVRIYLDAALLKQYLAIVFFWSECGAAEIAFHNYDLRVTRLENFAISQIGLAA